MSSGGGGGSVATTGSSEEVASDETSERRTQRDVYVPMLLGALDGVLAARRAGALSDDVRSAVHTFLHCMADSLGRDLLPLLPTIVDAYVSVILLLFYFKLQQKKKCFVVVCLAHRHAIWANLRAFCRRSLLRC